MLAHTYHATFECNHYKYDDREFPRDRLKISCGTHGVKARHTDVQGIT